jgi:SPX domain protein involved in polyphosphate accumulation
VRGDYSDVIVTMSRIHSALRGDVAKPPDQDEKQDFVRSTSKYWVHMEDVSRVKYIILQHLPVFLQDSMHGESDAQLVNSVYLDNRSFELYRGRLDKTPGAIALRMRWYGSSIPKTVFVERKTHRESWMGEISVKERFVVQENQVLDLIRGKYNKEAELERMAKKGTKADVVAEWRTLVDEVEQAIIHKQLEPTVRTQCMRTAFQIPFDATVRISLDTNLCMINERTENVVSGERWYRDPSVEIPKTEITRFPHAILEVKLQLQDEDSTPQWVTDLIHSGMLLEVHKFSKFIHGCATLMPDEVQSVPYWIDDPTLAESLKESGAGSLLDEANEAPEEMRNAYAHVLPHDKDGKAKLRVRPPIRKRDPVEATNYGSTESRPMPDAAMEIEQYDPIAHGSNTNLQKSSILAMCCGWAEADAMSTRAQKVRLTRLFLFAYVTNSPRCVLTD